jgi:hypothetical protein
MTHQPLMETSMKRRCSVSVAGLVLLLPAATAGQNRVVNGSFESPGLPFPGVTLPAGSTFITGWVVSQSAPSTTAGLAGCRQTGRTRST